MRSAVPVQHSAYLAATRLASEARQWLSTHALAAIVLLAFVAGLACIVVVPPWWHYDEPGHFEYAWLAAHSPTWPVEGQYDQAMRRQMAASMLRSDWYGIRNFKLNVKSNQPIPIGVVQVGDQPGYYFLASLPLRLLSNADMTVQYYAARLVSFLLFLLIVIVVWFALGEVLPGNHPLRWMTTVFVATLPAFVDAMASVNNDVGAVLAASLALWASLRLIQRGYSVLRLLFLAAGLVACYLAKSTALLAAALTPLTLILAFLRGRHALLLWGAAAVIVVGLVAASLTWGAPRRWYTILGDGNARVASQNAGAGEDALGKFAFRLDDSVPGALTLLKQPIPPDVLESLKGRQATFALKVWANQATEAGPFYVEFNTTQGNVVKRTSDAVLQANNKPLQYRLSFAVPADAVGAFICLQQTSHGLPDNSIFVDEIVLIPGSFASVPAMPVFGDASGARGTWDGHAFTNLVRNPSAEEGSFQIRQSVDEKTAGLFSRAGIDLTATLGMIQDWDGSSWYYRGAASTLFRTFWVSLAGDKTAPPTGLAGYFLILLTAAGVLGALVRLWVRRTWLRWDLAGFLAIAFAMPWGLALMRGVGDVVNGNPLFPWARYAFPGILPTALLLCAGWREWLERLALRLRLAAVIRDAIFVGLMLAIFLAALFNAVRIFHPFWWDHLWLLAVPVLLLAAMFYLYMKTAPGAQPPAVEA